jgi:hypothetical protein
MGLLFFSIAFFSFCYMAFMIFAVVDIVKSEFDSNQKLIWLLITIFVPFGLLIYFFVGRAQKLG